MNIAFVLLASANSEANVLGSELTEERQRATDLQYQLDSANARLTVTERHLQQVNIIYACDNFILKLVNIRHLLLLKIYIYCIWLTEFTLKLRFSKWWYFTIFTLLAINILNVCIFNILYNYCNVKCHICI